MGRGRRRRTACLCAAVAVALSAVGVGFASTAAAHGFNARRTVALEAWPKVLHVAVLLDVPAGKASTAATLVAPTDARLAALLGERSLDGLTFVVAGVRATLEAVEMKVARPTDPSQPLKFMLRGTIPLPPVATTVAIETGASGDSTTLITIGGKRAFSRASRGELAKGVLKAELGARDRVTLDVAAHPDPTTAVAPPGPQR